MMRIYQLDSKSENHTVKKPVSKFRGFWEGIWASRRRPFVYGVAIILIIGFIAYQFFGPLSPKGIRDDAITALETGNATELCNLASPTELKRLNITPAKVKTYLDQTLWSEGFPKGVAKLKFMQNPSYKMVWEIHWVGDQSDPDKPHWGMWIEEINLPGEGWKLQLSDMMRDTCAWKLGYGNDQQGKLWRDICKELDIPGIFEQTGKYDYFKR